MNAAPQTPIEGMVRPPRLIQSLLNGFNAVATHIYLILLPVALDLLLWFGPHLRVKALLEPGLQEFLNLMQTTTSADMRPVVANMGTLWKAFLDQYNLLSAASTFPVGVPSLQAGLMPGRTPLGAPLLLEVGSTGEFFLGWLLITLLGFLFGSLYFGWIARVTGREMAQLDDCPAANAGTQPFNLGTLGWQTLQVLAMIVMLLVILMVIIVPTLVVSMLLAMVSALLSQILILLVSLGAAWLLIPLIFSPHGIFLCGQNALSAMLNSARLVRFILPGTGLFLIAAIIINQGLGMLWSIPPATSWMALVGILGHAFIITGLLAASFVYYRGGLSYLQALRRLSMHQQPRTAA